jgi:hypothetical protein
MQTAQSWSAAFNAVTSRNDVMRQSSGWRASTARLAGERTSGTSVTSVRAPSSSVVRRPMKPLAPMSATRGKGEEFTLREPAKAG